MKKRVTALTAVACAAVVLMTGCKAKELSNEYVTVSVYKGVEVEKVEASAEVTDADVEAQIENILSSYAEAVEITDRAAQDGDIANIDYVGTKDGVAFDGGSYEGYDLTLGSGTFIEGFEEGIIGYFEDSFLLRKAVRYDVKGRKYIGTPAKYYYSDLGLRNARLGFRQLEETHIMENILYNDLIRRGMNVDVGVVEYNTKDAEGKKIRKQLEVDFVVNKGNKRFYIQSALSIADPEKKEQEIASLKRIPDSFSKMVVVRDYLKPWQDENGITYIGIEQFLLDDDIMK